MEVSERSERALRKTSIYLRLINTREMATDII